MQPYVNPNYFYPQQQQTQAMPAPVYPTPSQPQIAKIIPDFNSITVGDIPTNGMPGFFIKSDYSEIQSRCWTPDGRIEANSYKICQAPTEPQEDPFAKIMLRLDAIDEKLAAKPTRKKEVTPDE